MEHSNDDSNNRLTDIELKVIDLSGKNRVGLQVDLFTKLYFSWKGRNGRMAKEQKQVNERFVSKKKSLAI